ncbi:ferredoxin (plasmid) [Arthrobacter sp. D3-18]
MASIIIDFNRCEGHGLCEQASPEIFRLDEDGMLELVQEHVDPQSEPRVVDAVRSCPVAALKLQT